MSGQERNTSFRWRWAKLPHRFALYVSRNPGYQSDTVVNIDEARIAIYARTCEISGGGKRFIQGVTGSNMITDFVYPFDISLSLEFDLFNLHNGHLPSIFCVRAYRSLFEAQPSTRCLWDPPSEWGDPSAPL